MEAVSHPLVVSYVARFVVEGFSSPSVYIPHRMSPIQARYMYLERALAVRAESSSTSSTLAAETSSATTSDAPFFTSSSAAGQPNTDGSEGEESVTKVALEWIFVVVVLLAIMTIGTWRYARLKHRNQSMRYFFKRSRNDRSDSRAEILNTRERRAELPRTTGLPRPRTLSGASIPVAESLFYPPSLVHGRYPEPLEPAPAHLACSGSVPALDRGRRSRRAVRGANTDAYGRRSGQPDPDDWDGDDKEELPAYESVAIGGPPRYADADVQYFGGVPLRVLTLPTAVPESIQESGFVERRDESTDGSRSSSPARHRLHGSTDTSDLARHATSNNGHAPLEAERNTRAGTGVPASSLAC